MKKKQTVGIVLLLLLLVVFWIVIQTVRTKSAEEEEFVITAFPVGKADALLVQTDTYVMLVDTGEEEDGPYLLEELSARGIKEVDMLLITHFDKDHVGGAAYLMEHVDVKAVRMPDYQGERPEYLSFLETLLEHPDVERLSEIYQYTAGDLAYTIYPAEEPQKIQDRDKEYDNDMSLVTSLSYQGKRFLLTGDIEKERIEQMLASGVDWQHDWIKMPHHGRYQKALKALLEAVQPQMAVICCSKKEYAEDKTLKLLKENGIKMWDTSRGSVVTVFKEGEVKVVGQ